MRGAQSGLAATSAIILITVAVAAGAQALHSDHVAPAAAPPSSVASSSRTSASSTKTTVATARPPCISTQPYVIIPSPRTITLTVADGLGRYDVPVGTIINVHLDGSTTCGPNSWQAPEATPTSMFVSARDSTAGEVATASFAVVAPGDGRVTAVGACEGLPPGACESPMWAVDIHARAVVTTPSTLPRTQ
jgi:hypothetical protein